MKKTLSRILDVLADGKILVFLVVCLITHILFSSMYFGFGIPILGIVNIFSALYYALLIIRKNYSVKSMLLTYFEVLGYSMVSGAFTRGKCEFLIINVAMITSLTYLIPSYGKNKLYLQMAGLLACLVCYAERIIIPDTFMPEIPEKMDRYGEVFILINLFIVIGLVLYITFIYDRDFNKVQSELDYRSKHDALTGLYNRRYLNDLVSASKDEDIVIAMLDIDHFKNINDSYGHSMGDEVLVKTTSFFSSDSDEYVSVRWGGEEFVLFFRSSDTQAVYASVNSICDSVKNNVKLPDGKNITLTSGIAAGKVSSFEETVRTADEYLYYGKNHGRNCIIWSGNKPE